MADGSVRIRIEVCGIAEQDEIVIRCCEKTEAIEQLAKQIGQLVGSAPELDVTLSGMPCFVPLQSILFLETNGDRVAVHTSDKMYYTAKKLYQLEMLLPGNFMRCSKSCILNSAKLCKISRSVTGSTEVFFPDTHKKVFVSRMYYKALKQKLMETRGLK